VESILDLSLRIAVIALPVLFGVVVIVVPAKTEDKVRHMKWRWLLFGLVAAYSVLVYWQQSREQTAAQAALREQKQEMAMQAQSNEIRFGDITQTVQSLRAQLSARKPISPAQKFPTVEEIANAVNLKISQGPSNSAPENPSPVKPPVSPLPEKPAPAKIIPCRSDHLDECTDERLLDWGKPLVASIDAIQAGYMADLKKLDDIKGGSFNWLKEFVGLGDKDSKWLKEYDLAQKKAVDAFRDCCAERALAYHKELLHRTSGSTQAADLYQWVQVLMEPSKTKEWKKARESGGKVGDVFFDLEILQNHIKFRSN
jgi:hypothetical protein